MDPDASIHSSPCHELSLPHGLHQPWQIASIQLPHRVEDVRLALALGIRSWARSGVSAGVFRGWGSVGVGGGEGQEIGIGCALIEN